MSNVPASQKKRALILAGGGLKVAFQAGVLQVWLDEAGLTFDHADGASGGCLQLAMWCQGMTGTQIADNWRNLPVVLGIDFNWEQYAKLFYGASLSEYDRWRENIFPRWGLNWEKVRASQREATFNVYNFSKHELVPLSASQMTEEFLIACITLPMWFPPVHIDGEIYIDAVFITDGNLEEAIRRGADEIWVIWTVSERSDWYDGFVAEYFQIIETCANGNFRRIVHRVEANNAALATGKAGEFGRHIELKILRAEVPLQYLINIGSDRLTEAVNRGVQEARKWCVQQGIILQSQSDPAMPDSTCLSFTEEMKGYITLGESDYDRGFKAGHASDTYFMFHLTITLDGVIRFVTDPKHEGMVAGYIRCDALGGQQPVETGTFNLFVDDGDPTQKKMVYRLFFRDQAGKQLTLSGTKFVQDRPGSDVWAETSTLYVRILMGHVAPEDEATAQIAAAGIISVHMLDFLKQLTTFRVEGATALEKASALTRFGTLFLGKLWDVYARQVLSYGPF